MERLKPAKAESEQEAARIKEELDSRNRAKKMSEDRSKREAEDRESRKRRPAKKSIDEIDLANTVRKTLDSMKEWRDKEVYLESNEGRHLVEAAETYCGFTLPKRNHKYVVTQADLEAVSGTRYRPTAEQLQAMSPEEKTRAEAIRDYCRDRDCAIYIANNSYNICRDPSPESRQRSHTARADEFARRQAEQRLSVSSSTGYTSNSDGRQAFSQTKQLPPVTPHPTPATPQPATNSSGSESGDKQRSGEKNKNEQKVPPLKIVSDQVKKVDEKKPGSADTHIKAKAGEVNEAVAKTIKQCNADVSADAAVSEGQKAAKIQLAKKKSKTKKRLDQMMEHEHNEGVWRDWQKQLEGKAESLAEEEGSCGKEEGRTGRDCSGNLSLSRRSHTRLRHQTANKNQYCSTCSNPSWVTFRPCRRARTTGKSSWHRRSSGQGCRRVPGVH